MTTVKELREMKELYDSGMSLRAVGKRFGVTGQYIHQLFDANDIPRRKPYHGYVKNNGVTPPSERDSKIAEMYRQGKSRLVIAKEMGIKDSTVREALKRTKVKMRRMGVSPIFNKEEREAIRNKFNAGGRSMLSIAKELGVSHGVINRIVNDSYVSDTQSGG